jgi:hypothetical protein
MSDVGMKGKVHFLTFGAGGKEYEAASRRLAAEGRKSRFFSSVSSWHESQLIQSPYLTRSDIAFIRKNPRGFGYWLWKPIILLTLLDKMKPNDYLIYLDAGCELNLRNRTSRKKLVGYCKKARQEGLVAFETQFFVRTWTKRDLLIHTGFDSESKITKQIEAGVLILFNSPETREFLKQWLHVMRLNEYRLLDDSPSMEQNYPDFKEHRHDQAIFTVLYLNSGRTPIPSETFFGDSSKNWRKNGGPYPFWASRNVSRWPRHRPGIYGMLVRSVRHFKDKTLNAFQKSQEIG